MAIPVSVIESKALGTTMDEFPDVQELRSERIA